MKKAVTVFAAVVSAVVFAWNVKADQSPSSMSFNVHTRVGDGWHMTSTVTLNSSGQINGTTVLENHNNFFGFTGGVFAVALDENNEAVYSTEIHSFGINAAGFSKVKTRTVTWSDTIPAIYLDKVEKITVVQVHNPTYRVWTWIYQNRALIIQHAEYIADLYKKYKNGELDAGDIEEIVEEHLNRL
jgi:hypothetical protein